MHLENATFLVPYFSPSSLVVSSPSDSFKSDIHTFAPFSSSRMANSFPNPLADPVTNAILFLTSYTMIYFNDATLVKVFAEVFSGGTKKRLIDFVPLIWGPFVSLWSLARFCMTNCFFPSNTQHNTISKPMGVFIYFFCPKDNKISHR